MQPLFTADWLRQWKRPDAPSGQGRGGLSPSEGLSSKVAANDMIIATTVTDGNCGLHAFWLSAQHLFEKVRRQPWLSFKKMKLADALSRLRKLAIERIKDHSGFSLWSDFTNGDLIRSTAPDGSVQAYLDRMQRPGQWIDTTMLHALGCAFQVDIVVWQCGSADALLGASLMEGTSSIGENPALIALALQNDMHFWGCRPLQRARELFEPVDQGDWVLTGADIDEDETVLEEQCPVEADGCPRPESVNAELALCKVLATWSPFATPNGDLVQAMRALADANAGSGHSSLASASATEARFVVFN